MVTTHFRRQTFTFPKKRTTAVTKVLVLLHGGAWNSGDKSNIDEFVKLVQHYNPGLAVVNANYRLVSRSVYLNAQIEDVRLLLEYIIAQGSNWNVNTEQIALGGISAGAHLAMLYAYRYDAAQKINSVISIVGPAYFGDPYYTDNTFFQPMITQLLGKPPTDTASYLQASPAYVVAAGAPPTYMAYGGYDPLVPASNAIYLDKKLTELGFRISIVFSPTKATGLARLLMIR